MQHAVPSSFAGESVDLVEEDDGGSDGPRPPKHLRVSATIEKGGKHLTGTHDSSWVHTCTGNAAVINAAGYMMVHPFMTSKTKNINKRALAGKRQSGLDDNNLKHPLLE